MESKFVISVPNKNDGRLTQTHENEYGTWTVFISAASTTHFEGTVALLPSSSNTIFHAERVKIKTSLENKNARNRIIRRIYTAKHLGGLTYAFRYRFNYTAPLVIPRVVNISIHMPPIPQEPEADNRQRLMTMFETKENADITIKVEDMELEVHKEVLQRSEVFKSMLSGDTVEAQTGIITIEDTGYDVIEEMCRFLYCEEVLGIEELALELLYAADKYMIPVLVEKCERHLIENMQLDDYSQIMTAADKLNLTDLRLTAINFIVNNREKIIDTDGWNELKTNLPHLMPMILDAFMRYF